MFGFLEPGVFQALTEWVNRMGQPNGSTEWVNLHQRPTSNVPLYKSHVMSADCSSSSQSQSIHTHTPPRLRASTRPIHRSQPIIKKETRISLGQAFKLSAKTCVVCEKNQNRLCLLVDVALHQSLHGVRELTHAQRQVHGNLLAQSQGRPSVHNTFTPHLHSVLVHKTPQGP